MGCIDGVIQATTTVTVGAGRTTGTSLGIGTVRCVLAVFCSEKLALELARGRRGGGEVKDNEE